MNSKFKRTARENGKDTGLFYPERGEIYSLREIETKLYLRDSASLCFTHCGVESVVQGYVDLATAPPAIADSQWKYVRETDEWIPVFRYAGTAPLGEILHIEPSLSYYNGKRDGGYHAYFLGYEVKQYFSEGVVPCPEAQEPLPEIDCNFSSEEQRKRVEFVRYWCPLDSIEEAERKYEIYNSYYSEGQTHLVSRQYAGMV